MSLQWWWFNFYLGPPKMSYSYQDLMANYNLASIGSIHVPHRSFHLMWPNLNQLVCMQSLCSFTHVMRNYWLWNNVHAFWSKWKPHNPYIQKIHIISKIKTCKHINIIHVLIDTGHCLQKIEKMFKYVNSGTTPQQKGS